MMIAQNLFRLIPIAAIQISLFLIFSAAVNSPPVLGAEPSIGNLSWAANPEPDLAGYEIYFGDQSGVYNHPNSPISVGKVTSYNFPQGMLLPGVTHYFALKAKDLANNTSSLSNEISGELAPDTTPPTVSITAPATGSAVSGTVVVSATASDTSGIEQVQFFLDGNPLGNPDASAPFEINWNSGGLVGSHSLTARARDLAGLETTSSAISVTVIQPIFSLTINPSGSGTGTVTSDVGAIQCPGVCTDDYTEGTLVTLTAQADSGSTFSGWSGAGCSGTSPCVVTMTQTHAVFATFFIPGSEFQQDAGADGIVSLEVEHAHTNTPQGSHSWTPSIPAGFSGDGALDATPNNGTNNDTNYSTLSPQLDFEVNFVHTGTHHVWIRGIGPSGGDDSVHVGLDGQELPTGDRIDGLSSTWSWLNRTRDGVTATINVPTPGPHTVNVWMREDGVTLDKLVLTIDAGYVPTGTGPSESLGTTPPQDTTPPTVSITAPATGSEVSGIVSINATAVDNIAVTGVRFLVNDSPEGVEDTTPPFSINWDTTVLLPNSYDLKAIARDAAGNETTSTAVTVTIAAPPIDNTFPTVSITTPAEGAEVSGVVSIEATATDNIAVAGVRFLVNNVQQGTEDLTAPYSLQWDTSGFPLGLNELTAISRDTAGNETVSEITSVTVVEPPPPGNLQITNLEVVSGEPYEIIPNGLQVGESIYLDRPNWILTNVPGALAGRTFIRTVNTDKTNTSNPFLSFSINQDAIVYVGHDINITTKPSWLNSFTNTGMTLTTSKVTLELFSKTFPAGSVELGGNAGPGKNMYSVVVVENGVPVPDTTPPTVSLTAPNEGEEVFGVVTLEAIATDNIGVAGVRFLVNNVQIGVEETTGPYSTQWDTTPLIPGSFTLKAIARDAAGNETTSSIVNVTLVEPPTGGLAITNLSAQSGKNYEVKIDNLQNGERVYIDRSYTFTNVPGALAGSTYIKTANNDKNISGNTFLSFTVNQPVTVYVGRDTRINNTPPWLNTFTPTGMSLVNSDTTLELYSKSFPAGTVNLGGNNGEGRSMYSVVVTSP